MAHIGFPAHILLISLIFGSSLAEHYISHKEIIYVKEVKDHSTETELPEEVFLTLHKDASSDSFVTLFLQKILDLDISSNRNYKAGIATHSPSSGYNMYKGNDGKSFLTLERLPRKSLHVTGKICMDGQVVTIEPVNEKNGSHQKHYFSLDNSDNSACDTARNYQQHEFSGEVDENSRPRNFRLTNAFGTFPRHDKLNDRVKREVEQLTIELLMVIDYAAYSWWQTVVGKLGNSDSEVMAAIRQYYAYVFQGIDARFGGIEKQPFAINLAFAGLFVAKTEHESYWTTTSTIDGDGDSTRVMVNSSEALEKFQKWLDEADFLPKYDHAVLFTGTNLTYAGNPGNAGLAFASSMCRNVSNSSIVEDIFDFRTITYATQQVARALGTRDDMDNNDCLEFFNHIMTPKFKLPIKSFASNKWKFSSCSEQYLKDYTIELNEDGLTCLRETTVSEKYPAEMLTLVKELPGVTYSGRDQCVNAFGLNSDVCRIGIETGYSKICSGLLCTYPGSETCDYILPADGTPCGNKKYCWKGNCVEHEDAPESSDICAFGNDATIDCYKLVVSEPSQCYLEDIRYKCCKTCELFYTGVNGCEYGDRSDDCTLRNCINGDQDYASKTCCLTCLDGPTPFARPVIVTTTESTAPSPTSGHTSKSSVPTSSQPPSLFPVSKLVSSTLSLKSSDVSPFKSTSSFSVPVSTSSASTPFPLFLSSDVTFTEMTSQTMETTEYFYKTYTTSPLPHPSQKESTPSLTTANTNIRTSSKDASKTPYPESLTTVHTDGDISGLPNTGRKTDTITTNTSFNLSETTFRSADTVPPMSSRKHEIAHENVSQKPSYVKMSVTKPRDIISTTETTKISVFNDTSKSFNGALCSCPVGLAYTTAASPASRPVTETSSGRKCIDIATNQSFYNRMFFKDVARSMKDSQRLINSGVYHNIKSLYMAVSGQLRGFQREYENENESWREGSETPSNDDDDVNRKLNPIWRKHVKDLLEDLKRDVREMRYRVLSLTNRHLKEQLHRTM